MSAQPLRAGFGRSSITAFHPDLALFGWGQPDHRPVEVARPLFARALVLERDGQRVAYVCCDLGAIDDSLRRAVVDRVARLGLDADRLMLVATHTHCAPGGYFTSLFFAMTAPGLSFELHHAIVDGIVDAVERAVERLEPACAWVHEGELDPATPIAFNRSLTAYRRNPDVDAAEGRQDAVDKRMVVLRVDAADGRRLGLVSWYALHGTCVHSDRMVVHPDHKGEASAHLEQAADRDGHPDFVAIFAQGPAGDVTPNHRYDPRRGFRVGRLDDDLEQAAWVGRVQADFAAEVAERAPVDGRGLEGPLTGTLRYVDLGDAPTADGDRTAPPALGWAFTLGTAEGPGPLRPLRFLGRWIGRLRRALGWRREGPQGAKLRFWDFDRGYEGRIAGVLRADTPWLRILPDRRMRYYLEALSADGGWEARRAPLTPRRLPLQLLRLGPLVLAGVPLEPTTQSGRRLRASLSAALSDSPSVVISAYANAYAGYLTTPEEYAAQAYEGSLTLFGPATLPAVQHALLGLVQGRSPAPSARPDEVPLACTVPPPPSAVAIVRPSPADVPADVPA